MNQTELLKQIENMKLTRCFALLTFKNETNTVFFQYHGSTRLSLNKFVKWNFKYFNVTDVISISRSTINPNCVIVTIKCKEPVIKLS